MIKKVLAGITFTLLLAILSACGSSDPFADFEEFQGDVSEPSVSVQNLPDEPTKDEMKSQIRNSSTNDISTIIGDNFNLLETVKGENNIAIVYATNKFTVSELVSTLTSTVEPKQQSELIDNQQVLIYPDHFVTIKQSEEDPDSTLIEVASDQFVRDNYSPSFLQTYFALKILDDVLDVDDWAKKRKSKCADGSCYGGYSTTKKYNSGGLNTNRGMSSVRGGGPSAGK
ncbi:DUF4247 domain-containing protein [Aquibacillus kalidii]|uniref:DUF4247 domain-containing protein n=1 Tax=Aquibacillus kalidii TaxID=2762597 RepID=UPI00164806D6|nr:DUF4247 domain-containing protein [Aquibacillus kalidii]